MSIDIQDVKTLRLQPGQFLVVQVKGLLSAGVADSLKQQLVGLFEIDRVVVLDCSVSLSVVDTSALPAQTTGATHADQAPAN